MIDSGKIHGNEKFKTPLNYAHWLCKAPASNSPFLDKKSREHVLHRGGIKISLLEFFPVPHILPNFDSN